MRHGVFALATLLAVGTGMAGALAQKGEQPAGDTIAKVTAELIGSMLDAQGVQYNITRDSYDDPMVEVITGKALPALAMVVIFYDCNASDQCEDLMLQSSFSPRGGPDIQRVNGWNAQSRWARAYVNEDSLVILEMDINATGSIGVQNVQIMVNTYLSILEEFSRSINQ